MSTFKRCDRCKHSNEQAPYKVYYMLKIVNQQKDFTVEFTIDDLCESCAGEVKEFAKNRPAKTYESGVAGATI